MYKVAIIIPTLNEERFIDRCLNSVKEQSFPFEMMDVMVVDGGSTDRTREIVEGWSAKYPNVRLIHNPKKIQSVAFNIGVKESNAPYIVRLDAHATYDIVYVEKCIKKFSTSAKELGCAPELIGNVGGVWKILPQHPGLIAESSAILNKSRFGIGGASFRVGAKAGFVDTVPFGAFPRIIIERIGGMREDLPRGEDNEFNSRIRKHGYKIFLDPEIVCTYYARDTVMGCVRQMYANGLSVGHLFFVDRESLGFRHVIPLLFVVGLILGILIGLVCAPVLLLTLAAFVFYMLCSVFATILECRKYGMKYFCVLPWLFLLVHLSYGCGTMVGLIKKRQ